jgi:hypothetical protein
MAAITFFTAPKAFEGHIGTIQSNAIRSWLTAAAEVQVLMLGDEPGMKEAAQALGVQRLDVDAHARSGAPKVAAVFQAAQRAAIHPVLCYLNADILLVEDFQPAVDRVAGGLGRFLLVGQRWDLDVTESLSLEPGWQIEMRRRVQASGRLHRPVGSDYFGFPKGQYDDMPDLVIGRAGWDNWMIFDARRRRIPTIDASRSILVVHQNHDYRHLPGGAPHYRHPESMQNLRAAGGRETVFRLADTDWRLDGDTLRRKHFSEWTYPRRWEAGLMARLGPGRVARFLWYVFHPVSTFRFLLKIPPPVAASRRRGREVESTPLGGRDRP